jgi:hypothetical protein
MATTTPNFGWDVPTSSDYVKQGAVAIETLGDDIDATLWTALGANYPGLRLVKKQTIGSGVSTVNVTGAFSATYENYKIMVVGGVGSTTTNAQLRLGATTTGYYAAGFYVTYASTAFNGIASANNSQFPNAIQVTANHAIADINLYGPNVAKVTGYSTNMGEPHTGGAALLINGFLNNTTQYTDFTFIPASGTLTGGTIYVYGYGAS